MTTLYGDSSAVFSPCGRYRYRLERRMPGRRTMSVTMLNPSIADATKPDPTITKLLGFCSRLDVGRLIVTNLAALVSTDPKGLTAVDSDPIGVENDAHVLAAATDADLLVVAWGAGVTMLRGLAADRVARVTEILRGVDRIGGDGREVWCWGRTNAGHPRHPLMLAYSTPLEVFS